MANNTPEVRFEGFSGEWKERKLGEVTTSYSGGTPSAGNTSFYGGDIPFIRSAEINKAHTELFLTTDGLNSSSAKIVDIGDILYALYGATSGEVGISKINGAINQAILAIKPNSGYDSYFIMQWLRLQKQKIIDKYLQGGQGNLSGSIVKDLQLNFPSIEEQIQIGVFFKKLDDTIALQQQELDTLKQTKQGFLQKMFPKEGETVPEVRFPGFSGAWERKKAKDLCSISTGRGNTQDKVESGIYPFYVRSATIERSDDYLYDQEAVLTVGDGVGTGKVFHYVNGKYNLHQRVYRMYDFKDDMITKYFYYYFSNHFYRRVMAMTAKTSVDSVRMDMIAEMQIFYPCLKEQLKIVNLLDDLESSILFNQQELDAMKETKKAFLQKMFV